jgi:hypothetical protein
MKMHTKLDAGDVSVAKIDPQLCEDCGRTATHCVILDMRATGARSVVAELCKDHADAFAERLRVSLPPEK